MRKRFRNKKSGSFSSIFIGTMRRLPPEKFHKDRKDSTKRGRKKPHYVIQWADEVTETEFNFFDSSK